jgi:cytochrome c553
MLEHQHAIEQMADGLIIPSAAQWKAGAEALKAVPLRASDLPKDPRLTRDVAAAEDRVHMLAEQAAGAEEASVRVNTYAQIISACAQCHGLHGRIWGPGLPKTQPQ